MESRTRRTRHRFYQSSFARVVRRTCASRRVAVCREERAVRAFGALFRFFERAREEGRDDTCIVERMRVV